MSDQRLRSKVLAYFKNNPNKHFSYGKLARKFHIRKRKKSTLKKVLKKLEKSSIIDKNHGKYHLVSHKKLYGIFDANALTNGYPFGFVNIQSNENPDVKIYRENCANAYHDDLVEVVITKSSKNKAVGRIIDVIERKRELVIGTIKISSQNAVLVSDDKKFDNQIDIKRNKSNLKNLKNKKALVRIIDWGNRRNFIPPLAEIEEILGDSSDPNTDQISVMKQFGLSEKFSEEIINETEDLEFTISKNELTKRKDLRSLITFTIDPISAKDFDDAVSLERNKDGWRLYVHIADVSHYAPSTSKIFREAFKRGTSVYLLDKVIPMLPERISNTICSLQPEVEKLTISVLIDFDINFNIIRRLIYPSTIRSNARLNYKQVDDFFEDKNGNSIDEEVKKVLKNMRPLAQKLTRSRIERGSLDFDLPDTEFEFDENGSPINILRTQSTESHLLIEEFMLLANQFIADLIVQKSKLGIFRIHESPDRAKLGEFAKIMGSYNYKINFSHEKENASLKKLLDSIKTRNEHRVYDNLLLRNLMKAEYSPVNKGHFGLALNSYTHFTSPIRRFPDLVVHHLIKQNIFEWTSKRFSKKDMEKFAKRSSQQELVALQAERTLGRLKKNRFMKHNSEKIYESIIVNFNGKNIFVELDKYPIQGFIPLSSLRNDYYRFYKKNYTLIGKRTKRKFYLCQKVKVRVKKVLHSIEFELYEL